MLLLSLLLLVAAAVIYTQLPSMLIYSTYPIPVYLLLLASVGCALASKGRVLRWVTTGVTGLVATFFIVYTVALSQLAPHELAVKPGDAFPEFRLQTSTGDWFSPADLKGKKAALYIFYRGDW